MSQAALGCHPRLQAPTWAWRATRPQVGPAAVWAFSARPRHTAQVATSSRSPAQFVFFGLLVTDSERGPCGLGWLLRFRPFDPGRGSSFQLTTTDRSTQASASSSRCFKMLLGPCCTSAQRIPRPRLIAQNRNSDIGGVTVRPTVGPHQSFPYGP